MKQEKSNRGRKGYPLDFKWRVIDDLLATGESIATTSQRYGITTRTPLGPAPDSDAQKIDAARAKAALARLRDLTSVEGSNDPARTVRREGASRDL